LRDGRSPEIRTCNVQLPTVRSNQLQNASSSR
jgi:hypothetical protein